MFTISKILLHLSKLKCHMNKTSDYPWQAYDKWVWAHIKFTATPVRWFVAIICVLVVYGYCAAYQEPLSAASSYHYTIP